MRKVLYSLIFGMAFFVTACGNSGSNDVLGGDSRASNGESHNLILAHNLGEDHPVHLSLEYFVKQVEEKSDGSVTIEIFANGTLGEEREVLEKIQYGGVDITKVSAAALENFAKEYTVFSLPYIFEDENHFFESMEADAVKELYKGTEEEGFVGLTYYDSGARSFYTKDKPIKHPDDLKGMKIRVMDSQTQIDMLETMGGTPTPMPYGDIYTALQQGVIDGAESNETALTTGKHGEVAKVFSYDEHSRIPDIVLISAEAWSKLSESQQTIIKDAAEESTEYQKKLWAESIEKAVKEAKEMGVEFYEVDKEPFQDAVKSMLEEYRKDEGIAKLLDEFESLRH